MIHRISSHHHVPERSNTSRADFDQSFQTIIIIISNAIKEAPGPSPPKDRTDQQLSYGLSFNPAMVDIHYYCVAKHGVDDETDNLRSTCDTTPKFHDRLRPSSHLMFLPTLTLQQSGGLAMNSFNS